MSLFPELVGHFEPEEETMRLSAPFWSDLVEVWASAWDLWEETPEEFRWRTEETPTGRGTSINHLVQSFAKEKFRNREREGLLEGDGVPNIFTFYIHDRLLVRFNALTTVSSGKIVRLDGATAFKHAYFKQHALNKINNYATRITVGCMLDKARAEMTGVAISFQIDEHCEYWFPISDDAGGVLPMPDSVGTPPLNNPFTTELAKRIH